MRPRSKSVRWRTVHPHVRGEDDSPAQNRWTYTGSPPRAWGRSSDSSHVGQGGRFTPTCVGKMTRENNLKPLLPVHPHVRGEDSRSGLLASSYSGSPPRAWGRYDGLVGRGVGFRFTPTCVGKMVSVSVTAPALPVHPHVRGEDSRTSRPTRWSCGSPPRAWGRWPRSPGGSGRRRFTPTCVGKIRLMSQGQGRATVHPHVRGEDGSRFPPRLTQPGSPPRAWGRFPHMAVLFGRGRFTPTCVGKMP